MLTTQIILCGVAFEAEVEYTATAGDDDTGLAPMIILNNVHLLGYYPEGINSRSAQKGDYVYLNVKCDLHYLTLEEEQTLEDACWKHLQDLKAEAWDRNHVEESDDE